MEFRYHSQNTAQFVERYSRFLGILSACAVVSIWSGWITSSRWGITTDFSPIDLTWLRFATAAVITLPLSLRYRWSSVPLGKALVIALGCGFPYVWLVYVGLKLIPSANASVLINGFLPVITSIVALLFLNKRITRATWVLLAIIIISTSLMSLQTVQFSWDYAAGLALLLIATSLLAVYMVAVKAWNVSIRDIMVWVPLLNAILVFPFWLVYSEGIQEILALPPKNLLFHVVYQGVVVSVVALFLFSFAIKAIGALATSLFMALVPSVTAVLAMSCCGELPTALEWAGIALCSTGLFIYSIASQPTRQAD